jgi:Protein of unknown function (DUF2851)
MNERLLQFIWQHLYFNKENLHTQDGQLVQILFQGSYNTNQGPDFLDAKIKIGDVLWAGHIELHLKTSDWNKHGHEADEQYNSVILHAVWQHDIKNEQRFPVLELKSRVPAILLSRYNELMQKNSFIPCENHLSAVKEIVWISWKERMIAERLQEKIAKIEIMLAETKQHWEEVFWQLIARNFGITLNTELFEAVAKSVSVTTLAKHKSQIHQLEALLLGQAGLLNDDFDDRYPQMLRKEYQFLQKKYKLQPVHHKPVFLRMRPSNFPTVRFAQLAMLIHQSSHLFSKITEAKDLTEIRKMLELTANDFWHTHYTLQEASAFKKKHLGNTMMEKILINTIIPVLFSYGSIHQKETMKQKAIAWLQELPKEKNNITKNWEAAGVVHQSAFDSQALLFLKKNYCNSKNCLRCAVGNSVLKQTHQ